MNIKFVQDLVARISDDELIGIYADHRDHPSRSESDNIGLMLVMDALALRGIDPLSL